MIPGRPEAKPLPSGARALRPKWSALALAGGYVLAYVALDRLSAIQALHGIDITPWNPQFGLTLTLLVLGGFRYLPVVVLAPLVSSGLVQKVYVPPWPALAGALVVAAGYSGAALMLRRLPSFDPRLRRAQDVILVIAAAVAAAALAAPGFVAAYAAGGLFSWDDFAKASLQIGIGDAIGAVVLAPLLFVLLDRWRRPLPAPRRPAWLAALEVVAQLASIAAALALVFGVGHDQYSFELFYLLFLPVVWIATRHGLPGACWAVLAVQAGLIAALEFQDTSGDVVRTFQLVMFAVATTGLMLGAVVSERHRVARALVESEGRLAAILNTARDGVLAVDARGRIESVNPAVERLFARPARELVGLDLHDLFDAPRLLQRLASTANAPGGESAREELEARGGDGRAFPVELTVGQFGAGGDERFTLFIRDIAARREAEARARQHQAELAHVSRLSLAGEMASALAHELNQPLTAIAAYARGCLRLLRRPPAEPALLDEGIGQVIGEAERAGDIITRLREFVRTGTTERMLIDVATLVEGAVALARIEAAQNGIAIRLRIAPRLPPVLADRIQIEQVLLNLLRNGMEAILASGAEPRALVIEAKLRPDRAIEIAVSDSGPGVVAEVAARLFEPFVTTKPNGMGLGLSISRSIIEAHDGTLRLIAKDGGGAVFAFDLPAQEEMRERHGG